MWRLAAFSNLSTSRPVSWRCFPKGTFSVRMNARSITSGVSKGRILPPQETLYDVSFSPVSNNRCQSGDLLNIEPKRRLLGRDAMNEILKSKGRRNRLASLWDSSSDLCHVIQRGSLQSQRFGNKVIQLFRVRPESRHSFQVGDMDASEQIGRNQFISPFAERDKRGESRRPPKVARIHVRNERKALRNFCGFRRFHTLVPPIHSRR
jgi:hypothetical protein